jgi:hypothetical protein
VAGPDTKEDNHLLNCKNQNMKSKHIVLLLFAFLAVIAAITNPTTEIHREKIKGLLNAQLQKSMSERESEPDTWANAGQAFGNMIGGAFIDRLVENSVTSENYVLFSMTRVNWKGEEKNIGIGAFGNVWVSDDIRDALSKAN